MSDTLWGLDWLPLENAYWAHQPPALAALRALPPNSGEREQLAKHLAVDPAGYLIDVPIMVWGWPVLQTMTIRQNAGYTWIPNGLQPNVPTVPGANLPGLPAYNSDPPYPAGSIKVSTSIGDYPPYAGTPTPVTPVADKPLVGAFMFSLPNASGTTVDVYAYGPGVWSTADGPKHWIVVNGQKVVQDGATYKAVVNYGLDGPQLHFEKQ